MSGKNVAIVGTGASAIQIVPSIAPLAGKLYVFQRSAAYVLPKPDKFYSRLELSLFELVFLESSFELLSFDELSLAELSLELSFELSFEESSDLGLPSSFLESPPLSDDGA